ncbi:MAG: HEAT repeat domain-containing protein [Chitinispirillales bacterium]|jgi:hypothetical protein|nr:HEAT repeat domain-containing protein [Chitinispirillales bacterium]
MRKASSIIDEFAFAKGFLTMCGRRGLIYICAVVLTAGALCAPVAVTRWSALQFVPNTDMLPGGRVVVDADLAWNLDGFSFSKFISVQRIHLGFSEWVGVDLGYAGGFTMGAKACVVKENPDIWYVPTLTLGFQNIYVSREAYYFDGGGSYFGEGGFYPKNEFYLGVAKSSEWAKLRIHVGLLSALTRSDPKYDEVNPFIGIEKYFGQGLYVTVEGQQRSGEFMLSAFAVFRLVADRLEFNVGVLDAPNISRKRADPFAFRPTLRAGLKFNIGAGYNGLDGLTGVEDRIDRLRGEIAAANKRVDSIAFDARWNADRIHELSQVSGDRKEERARVVDELSKLRNLYEQEPFDPELVKDMVERIRDRYEVYSPHLRVIITEQDADPRIRRLAVSLIGEMKDQPAANILMSLLNRMEEPSLKIETIIALGKIKDPRCRQLLSTLRHDPDGGVAFTAEEVYRAMFGKEETPPPPPPPPSQSPPFETEETVPERRLNR